MKIIFLPMKKAIETDGSESIFSLAAAEGLAVGGDCGGQGTCGKCQSMIAAGRFRVGKHVLCAGDCGLACEMFPLTDGSVRIPEIKEAPVQKAVQMIFPEDFISDAEEGYGIAFDIGTTSVAAMLWQLKEKKLMAAEGCANPQRIYGADVISRILYTQSGREHLHTLQMKLTEALNRLTERLCRKAGIGPELVVRAAAAGNSTMVHLLLGVSPESLGKQPFKPVFTEAVKQDAKKLGLCLAPGALIYVASGIGGHVGSDLTAGVIACHLNKKSGTSALIDIGTNGEIIAANRGRMAACSTAAGPAFEGASIRYGMRAEYGAVVHVQMLPQEMKVSVIADAVPVGICGSGLIDVVAGMLEVGILDRDGRILDAVTARKRNIAPLYVKRLRDIDGIRSFIICADDSGKVQVAVTQKDIREVQLAKAAISAGVSQAMKILTGGKQEIPEELYIAGAFGSFIRIASAVRIGLIPDMPLSRIHPLGNAAGTGISMILMSEAVRRESEAVSRRITHFELSQQSEFNEVYIQEMHFGKNQNR